MPYIHQFISCSTSVSDQYLAVSGRAVARRRDPVVQAQAGCNPFLMFKQPQEIMV